MPTLSPRFFVVPFAAACVLVALALTQPDNSPSEQAALAVAPAARQLPACDLGGNGPERFCTPSAG